MLRAVGAVAAVLLVAGGVWWMADPARAPQPEDVPLETPAPVGDPAVHPAMEIAVAGPSGSIRTVGLYAPELLSPTPPVRYVVELRNINDSRDSRDPWSTEIEILAGSGAVLELGGMPDLPRTLRARARTESETVRSGWGPEATFQLAAPPG